MIFYLLKCQSILWMLLQYLQHEVFGQLRKTTGEFELGARNQTFAFCFELLLTFSSEHRWVERWISCQEFVDQNSNSPDINPMVMFLADSDHFWSLVQEGSTMSLSSFTWILEVGPTKISYFDIIP